MRQRLSDRIHVTLPAEEAFQLFTPRGEREWAHGWDPTFPVPTVNHSEPGTVFETGAHGHRGTWLGDRPCAGKANRVRPGIPGERAGSITVTLEPSEDGTDVEVVYDLTPLSDAGARHLEQFANGYGDHLRSWQDAIAACLENRTAQ